MDVTGKINVFAKEIKNGSKVFSTTISKKDEHGKYKNAFLDVVFDKKVATKETLNTFKENVCYVVQVNKGFLTPDFYTRKDGTEATKFVIYVQDAKVLEAKDVSKKEANNNGLPF